MQRYDLLDKIDEGGFGVVWRARCRWTGRLVAIKFLLDANDPDGLKAFWREVRILGRGLHSAIVKLVDHQLHTGTPYYVMPYFEGGTLEKHAGKLPLQNLIAVAHRLCEGIAYLHANQIVHGDIKPPNVLVDANGGVQHGDPLGNGSGCTVSFNTMVGGTPGYMAPELDHGWTISSESDAFSFGALLFHMVTGANPRFLCRDSNSPGQLDIAQALTVNGMTWSAREAERWMHHPLRQLIWDLTAPNPSARPTMWQAVGELASEGMLVPLPPLREPEFGLGDLLLTIAAGAFVGVAAAGGVLLVGAALGALGSGGGGGASGGGLSA